MLEALLRRQGGVASKQDILDEVWGADFPGDPNIVEVYIRYLRKKLDLPFGRRHDRDRSVGRLPAGAR